MTNAAHLSPAVDRPQNGMRTFVTVWLGQLFSLIGSGLTGFTLGLWVLERTGSATQFALIALFTVLPTIVISPLAGAFVDRYDRRRVMMLADAGAGLSTLLMAFLLFAGELQVWHIYLTAALSASFGVFQLPAYSAATASLVPKKHLGRANGMVQMAEGIAQIIAPVLAGVLLVTINIKGIIIIDISTFLFAVSTLAVVRFPRVGVKQDRAESPSLYHEAVAGWRFLTEHQGLLGLIVFAAITNLLVGTISVLYSPMVLGFAGADTLGLLLSVGGLGMLAGSLAMSVWGGPKRLIHGVLGFTILLGITIALGGLRPFVPLVAFGTFVAFFSLPIINGSSQALLQLSVPQALQGRVFAFKRMISLASLPLAYIAAGPLSDVVFEPLMQPDQPLAEVLGFIIGVGEGRGIGLVFVVMGLLTATAGLAGYGITGLRSLNTLET